MTLLKNSKQVNNNPAPAIYLPQQIIVYNALQIKVKCCCFLYLYVLLHRCTALFRTTLQVQEWPLLVLVCNYIYF